MMTVDSLILDAKKAILEEQHRRLQTLRAEQRWEDVLQQLAVTLGCAADVLQHSLGILHAVAADRRRAESSDPPSPPTSTDPTDHPS